MSTAWEELAETMVEGLLEENAGEITASCLAGKRCKDGYCRATLTKDGGTLTLITGIVPNPDHLGSCELRLVDIDSLSRDRITFMVNDPNFAPRLMSIGKSA